VLESSQIILVSTVLKLFEMLQQSEGWTLGEVEVNSRGRPVVHHIADLLGCIRPHSDLDLPERSLLPESKENMVALAEHLRQQQEPLEREREQQQQQQQQERQRRGQQDRKETKDQPFNLHPLHKAEPKEEPISPNMAGMPRYDWRPAAPGLKTEIANDDGMVTPESDRHDANQGFGLTSMSECGPTLNPYGNPVASPISPQSLDQTGSHTFDPLTTTAMFQPGNVRTTFNTIYSQQGHFPDDGHMYHQLRSHQQGRPPLVVPSPEFTQFRPNNAPPPEPQFNHMMMGSHDPVLCPVYDQDGKPCLYP
jgi:hypothetical protein